MPQFFIQRPIFAWVIALFIVLFGLIAIPQLPIARYPSVAPPSVTISASYPGATPQAMNDGVIGLIERELSSVKHLLYFESSADSSGEASITATFKPGTDPELAQVDVQNKIKAVEARLPQSVRQNGLNIESSSSGFLMIIGLRSDDGRVGETALSDYLARNTVEELRRIEGVGRVQLFGAEQALRVWVDPSKLIGYGLSMADVNAAIARQNVQIAPGRLGDAPAVAGQRVTVPLTVQGQLESPEQFAALVLRANPDGSKLLLRDVAKVEIGSQSYNFMSTEDGKTASAMGIQLAPGGNAVKTAQAVLDRLEQLKPSLPRGLSYSVPFETAPFVKISIEKVVHTLLEAMVLVFLVMYLFLQNVRYTLIPAIVAPIALLGTMAVMLLAGFSINVLTMFGMVLAIGIIVDDAIVVVENVERLMHENPNMTPRQATIASMREINVALIAIALVLSAVFLPMVMFGGSTGVIYRQFSLTIVSSMALSVLVALVLSPALTATLLKSPHALAAQGPGWFARRAPKLAALPARLGGGFNRALEGATGRYLRSVQSIFRHRWLALLSYALIAALLGVLFLRLPTGFLPSEDQGRVNVQFRLPGGATLGRTSEVRDQVNDYLSKNESELISAAFIVAGGGGPTASQNSGQGFVSLVDWSQRETERGSADAMIGRVAKALSGLRDASVFVLAPPPIRGFGQTSGFTLELQNTSGMSRADFAAASDKLIAAAQRDPLLGSVRPSLLPDTPTLRVNSDAQMLSSLGLTQDSVNSTLSTAWGGTYVNDFIDRGRVKRVYVQGDAPYRNEPQSLYQWHVRGADGQMTPFSAFATLGWAQAPTALLRFNGVPATELQGTPAPGVSSGTAMARMEELAREIPGVGVAWSGLSYQERLSTGQAPLLYALALLLVFLCLAALYESWSIPIAVLLVVPLGLVGAVLAVTLRGLENDVYFQIGLITTMGLAAKNAILIVEFAEQAERRGKGTVEAALEAARLRLRPILMTSFAFIFGALPLALSTGGGANSRIEIGTAVVGGTLTATVLAVFYIPLFYLLVRKAAQKLGGLRHRGGETAGH